MAQSAKIYGLKKQANYSDLVLAVGVLLILSLMVLRLPTALIDALVAVNISIGVCLLLIAIYVPSPVTFSSFPSVLLISTLFRLALGVATTRLILLEADAGSIIHAFGNFVAGGNLVVGMVVFIIITVVQFIVIAKGAERVAEVSARFTLDAMPGKQLSIDSDLRSGLIEKEDAKSRRRMLESENQLHGALDGAMKFVKGDAIASIVIVVVNLLGGLTVGMAQRGLDFSHALEAYSILTIGDGMVAQIPALLSAMAAGLVVTRATGNDDRNLGMTIGRQISAQPRALLLTAAMAVLLAFTPGFPTLVFLAIAATLLLLSGVMKNSSTDQPKTNFNQNMADSSPLNENKHVDLPIALSPPLVVELPEDIASSVGIENARDKLECVRQDFVAEFGVPIPAPDVVVVQGLTRSQIRIFDVVGESPEFRDNDEDTLDEQLRSVLRARAGDFLGIQEVTGLLEMAMRDYPALVREVNRHLSNQQVAEVLRNLIAECVPIRNLRTILESLAANGEREKSPPELTELARIALKHLISDLAIGSDDRLQAIAFGPDTEAVIRAGLTATNIGVMLSLPAKVGYQIREAIASTLQDMSGDLAEPVLITPADIRRHVRSLTVADMPALRVVSFPEILPGTRVEIGNQIALRQ